MKFSMKSVALAASAALLSTAFAGSAFAQAMASRVAPHLQAADQGLASDSAAVSVALSLKVNNLDELKSFVAGTVDPSSPHYRKFLTPEQFAKRYGQSEAAIQQVKKYLEANGVHVKRVFDNKLVIMASGTNAKLTRLFGSPIHSFATTAGQTFQRPTGTVTIPAALQGVVAAVHGLSTEPRFHLHSRGLPAALVPAQSAATSLSSMTARSGLMSAAVTAAATPTFGNPGTYTVKDLATRNNVNPLYAQGYTGAGVTLGIMTFASFSPSDATTYWASVGITRTGTLTVENVSDGDPSDTVGTSGAGETALDVEQSGGLAPGANVIVYQAPNTDAGAIALYAQAISENKADTLSVSWGETELAYGASDLQAYDTLFLQAAAQGVPVTAASADAGAYDLGNDLPFPYFSPLLNVDYPASDPYVLAAGGTTLPVTLKLTHGTVTVPQERPWGWDYLQSYITTYYGSAYYYANLFPSGDGGGVSVQYQLPSYQVALPGVRYSMPGQTMVCMVTQSGTCNAGDVVVGPLPANYPGRNVPDVSMNADPETGYAVYSTGDGNTGWMTGYGGTSFVAPQLNGIFALITQKVGHRLGFLHPQLYGAFRTYGYGTGSPFRAITSGDNLFWPATNSYNPGAGLGTLDVSNLSAIFH